MQTVFQGEIDGWASWGEVFQSLPDFEDLIYKIYQCENLPKPNSISHLTPGTNAVFRVDDTVVKIYAPVQSGLDTAYDFSAELFGMRRAEKLGLHVPAVLAASSIDDKYLFRYIVMEYIDAVGAKTALKGFTKSEKIEFVSRLKEVLSTLNVKTQFRTPNVNLKERAITNKRWSVFSDKIRQQLASILLDYEETDYVYVHGDLTGDNVLISKNNSIHIIDFADSLLAPKSYEYPPILFDLFDFDKAMIREFARGTPKNEFIEDCFTSILLHDFGADIAGIIIQKVFNIAPVELSDILLIKEAISLLLSD